MNLEQNCLVIKISNLLVPDGTPNNSNPPSQKIQTRIFWFRMILPPAGLTINFSNLLVQNDVPDSSNPPNQKIQARIFWFGINYSLDYSGSESKVTMSATCVRFTMSNSNTQQCQVVATVSQRSRAFNVTQHISHVTLTRFTNSTKTSEDDAIQ